MCVVDKLKNLISELLSGGIKVPMIYDHHTDGPSIIISFPYIAFVVVVYTIMQLAESNILYATVAALTLWLLATVLYIMRKLTKAKFDVDDQSIDLESEPEDDKTPTSNS